MHDRQRERDRRKWREARSYRDLCRLAEEFLRGRLLHFPGWGSASLDEESEPLRVRLAELARQGFLPVASQPGRAAAPDDSGAVQARRAFVGGFVDERAERALRRLERPELVLRLHGEQGASTPALCVGESDGRCLLYAGHDPRPEERRLFRPFLAPPARLALAARGFAWVVDLAWAERDLLWTSLQEAFAKEPSPPHSEPAAP